LGLAERSRCVISRAPGSEASPTTDRRIGRAHRCAQGKSDDASAASRMALAALETRVATAESAAIRPPRLLIPHKPVCKRLWSQYRRRKSPWPGPILPRVPISDPLAHVSGPSSRNSPRSKPPLPHPKLSFARTSRIARNRWPSKTPARKRSRSSLKAC